MSSSERLACVAITMILANAYILILCTLQMRHNIKYAKRLIRLRHRLGCKKFVLESYIKSARERYLKELKQKELKELKRKKGRQ